MTVNRPATLKEIAERSESLQDFGLNLRDWQHEVKRAVHSRKGLSTRLADAPSHLADHFEQGDVADAYLAAYAEWLADRAGISRPEWCTDKTRIARNPWFSAPTRGLLLLRSPASFRQRDLFTIPEQIFTPRAGRPRVSTEHKREKARQRQKAYRARIGVLVERARANWGQP